MKSKRCPLCKRKMVNVIYAGFPMYLCSDDDCNTVDGFWSEIMEYLPFNGMFFVYKGNYWKALYRWLFN
jgi:hypothetical protein